MDKLGLRVRESSEGLDVHLHVHVRARANGIAGIHGGALKLKIASPPVDNAANEAIIRLFSSMLSIPKSRMRIVSGQKSRDKILRIDGMPLTEFLAVPEIEKVLSAGLEGST